MHRIAICTLTILVAVLARAAAPDFAYPAKVRKDTRTELSGAIAADNGPKAVRLLMDYTLASAAIDTDSTDASIALIDSVAARLSSPGAKALCSLLRARILEDVYLSDRYNFDTRKIPTMPLPASVTQWNGAQFTQEINNAVDNALNPSTQALDIREWIDITNLTKNDLTLYPTLYDFIANRCISLLNDIDAPRLRITAIYDSLIKAEGNNTDALINTIIARLNYLRPEAYSDSLLAISQRFATHPYGGEALTAIPIYVSTTMTDKQVNRWKLAVADLRRRLETFPRYSRNGCLKMKLASLTEPQVTVTYQSSISPDDKLKADVSIVNAKKVRLNIVKVPSTISVGDFSYHATASTIASNRFATVDVPISDTLSTPYIHHTSVSLPQLPFGRYIIVPVINGDVSRAANKSYSIVCSTSMLAVATSYAGKGWFSAVNIIDGRPVASATVSARNNRGETLWTTVTGSDGEAVRPVSSQDNRIFITKGRDRYATPVYSPYSNSSPGPRAAVSVTAFTSLPLYHPSDSVVFTAVMQSAFGPTARPVQGVRLSAIVRNPNYQPVDTITAVTDRFGRIIGTVRLPADGLTGNWTLTFVQNGSNRTLGSTSFSVSDYRLPEYELKITGITRRDSVTVDGIATTYTGFPVAGARVALRINAERRSPWRWYGGETKLLLRDTIATKSDGTFSYVISKATLDKSPWRDAIIDTEVTFTAPDGEVASTSRRFTLGPQYNLDVALPEAIDVDSITHIDTRLSNLDGGTIKAPLSVIIYRGRNRVDSLTTDGSTLDLTSLLSGEYKFIFRPVDTSLSNPTDTLSAILYRRNEKLSPVPNRLLWTPSHSLTTDPDGTANALYALGSATRWIHYALTTDSTLIDRGVAEVGTGMSVLPVSLPSGIGHAILTLWAAGDYSSSSEAIIINRPTQSNQLKIEIEILRDNLTPGAKERWTVKVTDADGNADRAAVIMDIFAKSLTTLRSHSLDLQALSANSVARFAINDGATGSIRQTSSIPTTEKYDCALRLQPQLQTYGMSFYPRYIYNLRAPLLSKAEATMAGGTVVYQEKAMMRNAAMSSADAIVEETAVEGEADTGSSEIEGTTLAPDTPAPDYRNTEEPLALFATSLTTTADGTTTVAFTLPNANTTWRILALAYNSDLKIGTLSRDIVASKPLMVSPNLPRFLRQGDTAKTIATVMNATDSTLVATTVVETFDPVKDEILSTFNRVDTIAPNSTATVNTEISATGVGVVGYRVLTSTPGFTDGEQTLLPILPAAQPIVKSDPFYITSSDTTATVQCARGGDTSITINTNPIWSVVTALPGLTVGTPQSASSATAALFGTAVARGLLSKYGWIKTGLQQIVDNPQDSTLISALQRNASLKTLMLNQTPWVSRAMSQTERMSRLSLALDSVSTAKSLNDALSTLVKLQRSSGGLAWREQYPTPSPWLTRQYLMSVSQLRSLGFVPADDRIDRVTRRALAYCDSLAAVTIANYPRSTDLDYTFMRYRFKSTPQPAGARQLIDNSISMINRTWKSMSLTQKAMAALILHHNGNNATAHEILASMRQYSVDNKTLGVFFPSIANSTSDLTSTALIFEAFNTMLPDDTVTEGLRQWLLLQKETRDWGSATSTSWIVSTLLTASRPSTLKTASVVVDHNGTLTPVDISSFATTIAINTPAKVTISKPQGQPAWGAVIDTSVQLPSKVKTHSTGDLSIEKRLLKLMPDGKWRETTQFEVGDIVEISFTIKANRAIDFVTVTDPRAAAFQPVEQLPGYIYADGLSFYRENGDAATNIFIDQMPRGTYVISYRVTANNAGVFTSGIATISSQYSPEETANSTAPDIIVNSTNH